MSTLPNTDDPEVARIAVAQWIAEYIIPHPADLVGSEEEKLEKLCTLFEEAFKRVYSVTTGLEYK